MAAASTLFQKLTSQTLPDIESGLAAVRLSGTPLKSPATGGLEKDFNDLDPKEEMKAYADAGRISGSAEDSAAARISTCLSFSLVARYRRDQCFRRMSRSHVRSLTAFGHLVAARTIGSDLIHACTDLTKAAR